MKQKLADLYELQLVDIKLDSLEELRGDLPLIVNELNAQMKVLQNNIEAKELDKNTAQTKREENDSQIKLHAENLTKYKAQLYKVRNNKEYDALTKEIDFAENGIKELEKENDEFETKILVYSDAIGTIEIELEKLKIEFSEKEEELTKIIQTNEKEESRLREIRDKVAEKIRKPEMNTYCRIRKAKGGIAVSSIVRGACSGCHSVIPPQRQLEIKKNNRSFNCEACGRILVSTEISLDVEQKINL